MIEWMSNASPRLRQIYGFLLFMHQQTAWFLSAHSFAQLIYFRSAGSRTVRAHQPFKLCSANDHLFNTDLLLSSGTSFTVRLSLRLSLFQRERSCTSPNLSLACAPSPSTQQISMFSRGAHHDRIGGTCDVVCMIFTECFS